MKEVLCVVAATVVVMAASGCSSQSRPPSGDSASRPAETVAPAVPNASAPAQSKLAQLEADARALAKTTGCNAATECRTAPLGERACGGPRDYIAYCAATTDSVALFRKLDEIKAAEVEFNKASNAMSTCEFRMPPKTAIVGGSCRAAVP